MSILRKSVSFVILAMVAAALGARPPESPTKVATNPVKSEFNPPPPPIIPENALTVAGTGQTIFWDNAVSGTFQDGGNWVGGLPPGVSDFAYFGQNASASAFVVSFTADVTNQQLVVQKQRPTFNLTGRTYTVSSGFTVIGVFSGADGSLTVDGGTLDAGGSLVVGTNGGVGLLRIQSGGTVTTIDLGVGTGGPPSDGTIVVTGPGSSLLKPLCCDMGIGYLAGNTGRMTVENSATVSLGPGNHIIGREGGEGILTLQSGGQLSLTDSNFVVAGGAGGSGPVTLGHVSILSGSDLNVVNGAGFIATGNTDAFGEVTVSGIGSTWTLGAFLDIGESGHGTLTIENGGDVSCASNTVGTNPGAIGEVTVDGNGSKLESIGLIRVGFGGAGYVSVLGGATVMSDGVLMAQDALSTGDVLISGTGSIWTSNDVWNVGGAAGSATLLVENGGEVVIVGAPLGISPGYPGSTGQVTVTGAGSSLSTTHELGVGAGGQQGQIIVQNGATVSCRWGRIGWFSPGTMTVDGVGSTLTVTDNLHVGESDLGLLTISNGAVVSVLNFGEVNGSGSEALITGTGSRLELTGAFFVFNAAKLTVSNGGVVSTSSLELETGDGKLYGNGTIDGRVNNNSGFVFPGSSAGILTILGDYLQQGRAGLHIEVGGLTVGTQYDRLAVTGNADLHGTLDLSLINAFTPTAGDSFDIVTYATQSGRFDTIIGSSPVPGLRWALDYNPTVLTLIACDPVADPSCDDCNLNGVLDGEDIANLTSVDVDFNGIPDECALFVQACSPPSDDWSCFDNWELPGDLYPDDVSSAAGVFVTLNGTDDVLLDVDATIPGLRILDNATLHVAQTGTGDLTVNSDKGMLIEGSLLSGNDRSIEVPSGTVKIAPEGVYAEDTGGDGSGCSPPVAGNACSTLSAARIEIIHGHCETPIVNGGSMTLTDSMSVSTTGDFVMTGLPQAGCNAQTAGPITPPPKLRLRDRSRMNVAVTLSLSGVVDVVVDTLGDSVLSGNFDNRAILPSLFNWSNGTLTLNGSGQVFEVAGLNLGQTSEGYNTNVDTFFDTNPHTNFSMAAIEVASGADVRFANNYPNTKGFGCEEALYVRNLTLRAGASVTVDNCKVYYTTLTNEGVTPILLGCGELLRAVNDIVWDSDPASLGRTTRSLRFTVTGEAGPSKPEAIKVTMVDLMHPDPRNLTQYPPPSYATFDTLTHGTCGGAVTSPNYNGHHCAVNADCLGPNMGITTDDGTCSLPGPACTAAGEANGCARWVGKPGTFYEFQGPPQAGPYRAARLQCTPYYHDWKPEGLITVVGAEIIPSSEYSVQTYAASCMGAEGACAAVSLPVTMYTRRKGDLDDLYQTPSPDALTQANAIDVAQSVNAVKHILGAPSHARAQMQPNLPELNTDVNVLDIVEVVDSLKRTPYSFPGPCVCPSTVTCGGSCTGCAGLCVKVCTSGDNVGEPCINNTHCPNGTCAAAGTCRDKCGRCTP